MFGNAYETGAWATSSLSTIEPLMTYTAQQTPHFLQLIEDHLKSYRGLEALRNIPPELQTLVKHNQDQSHSPRIEQLHHLLNAPLIQRLNQHIVFLYGKSLRDFLGLL